MSFYKINNSLFRNRHRYLSRSVFVQHNPGPSDITRDSIDSVSLYDYIEEILTILGCCSAAETNDDFRDVVIPMNAFVTKNNENAIDLFAAIQTVANVGCGCTPVTTVGPNYTAEYLKSLYLDMRTSVSKPVLGYNTGNYGYYIHKPKTYNLAGNPNVMGPNNALYLSELMKHIADEVLDCCIEFPTCSIALNPDMISLDLASMSNFSGCGGAFTATIEFFKQPDLVTPVITFNYTEATYPSNLSMVGIGLTDGTWTIRHTITDCVASATCSIVYVVPPITNEITYTGTDYVTIDVHSNSPLCSGQYTVTYNIVNSSMVTVYTATYDETNNPGYIDIDALGLACDDYTFESIAADCVSFLNDYSNFTIIDPPIAAQNPPNTAVVGDATLDADPSTACDTDLEPNLYSWCLLDDFLNVIEVSSFVGPASSITGSTYITGTGLTPTVDIEAVYDNEICDVLPDAQFNFINTSTVDYNFDASSSYAGGCPSANITNYTWKIYDQTLTLLGTVSSASSLLSYTFPNIPQTYHVVLTITSTCGMSSIVQSLDVSFEALSAFINKAPTGTLDEFDFDATSSYPGTCPTGITSYTWDFIDTDGITVLFTSSSPTVTYQFTGTPGSIKYVRLIISDGCNQVSSVTESYTLGSACGTYTFPNDIIGSTIGGLKITSSLGAAGNDITIKFTAQV